MALTLESVCAELGDAERMDDVCPALAHGSLMGARGNSGVILSQILRGLADTFRDQDLIGSDELVVAACATRPTPPTRRWSARWRGRS